MADYVAGWGPGARWPPPEGASVVYALIASLGRPGGNVTGLATPFAQLDAKQLEFLKEAYPRLTRVAVLWNPANGSHTQRLARLEALARSLDLEVLLCQGTPRG